MINKIMRIFKKNNLDNWFLVISFNRENGAEYLTRFSSEIDFDINNPPKELIINMLKSGSSKVEFEEKGKYTLFAKTKFKKDFSFVQPTNNLSKHIYDNGIIPGVIQYLCLSNGYIYVDSNAFKKKSTVERIKYSINENKGVFSKENYQELKKTAKFCEQ